MRYLVVESRKGAVARKSALRLPSPLIKPDVRIPASGFPTGFIARLTAVTRCACA